MSWGLVFIKIYIFITPLAIFLIASVMVDAQIHYNLKILLFLCHGISFQEFLGNNVLV